MFMHGLYFSGDVCIIPGPGKAHCYIYSDNCYEVWVPNVRGTVYSRNHTYLNPDKDSKFWDFSLDEMALFDLPPIIDYVIKITSNPQITYMGHSQGMTILLILCAKEPEYNSKIKLGFGLSSSAWMAHSRLLVLHFEAILDRLLASNGENLNAEIFNRGGVVNNAAKLLCGTSKSLYQVCSNMIFILLGYNEYQITSDVLPVIVGHAPAGTSLKNFIRWGQMKNNGFSEYDNGEVGNLKKYGHEKPPLYDVSKITMKWVMISSLNDYVGDVRDIKLLVSKLPNASMCVLSDVTFGHLDFVFGKDVPKYITPGIISSLEEGEYKCP